MKKTHAPSLFSLIGSVICAAMCPSARAYYYYNDDTIEWKYNVANGCATITGATLQSDYWDGSIPSSFNYYDSTIGRYTSAPVTAIGDRAFSSLLSDLGNDENGSSVWIELPDTVRRIGDEAFFYSENANSTFYPAFETLPPDIEYIGSASFWGCRFFSYDDVDGVIVVDGWAVRDDGADFSGTSQQYNIPRIIDLSFAKGISAGLFAHGRPMKITLPSALKILPNHAFYWCDGLKEIVIPATVTNIEYCAFTKCSSLTNITFAGNAPVVADPWGMSGNPIQGVFEGVNSNCVVTVQRGTTGWGEVPGIWQGMAIRYADEELPPAPVVVDLSTLTGDYTASDGDILTNSTAYVVTVPGGATVTINGVTVTGGGAGNSPATFAESGEALTSAFTPGANGTWRLTAYAELASGSAAGLADSQIKVRRADTVAGLATAEPTTSGVTVLEKAPAVKVDLEVAVPTNTDSQFFRVEFGE